MPAPDFELSRAAGNIPATPTETSEYGVDEAKRAAANWAVAQLQNGMVVGLGSRSTAAFAVAAIGQRVREGLRIMGIPTSENTFQQASRLGIALSTLSSHPRIDVTIDGADEVELHSLNLIKGGGGNLLREKIVAVASTQLVIIAADQKAFITDGGNYILDCTFGPIKSAQTLQAQLDATVGVIEHGLFVGITSQVVVGYPDGVRIVENIHDPSPP
jgi:ribose 5-phosphate isomerase A